MPWMYGVDLMVKVPLFWQRKQRPMIAEAAATLESGRQMRDATASMASAQVTEEYLAGDDQQPAGRSVCDSVLAAGPDSRSNRRWRRTRWAVWIF